MEKKISIETISFKKMAEDILGKDNVGPLNTWEDRDAVEEKIVLKVYPNLAEKYKTASLDAKMAYLDSVKFLYIEALKNGGQNAANS